MIWSPVTQAILWERQSAEEIKRSADRHLEGSVRTQHKSLVRVALLGLAYELMNFGRCLARHLEDQSGNHGQAALTTERMIHSH